MSIDTIREAAAQRALDADKVWREARTAAFAAWAEMARLDLIRLCEENPLIAGLSFETEYEYDDEGGYFPSVSTYPLVADGTIDYDIDPDYEFHDLMGTYGHEILCVLCGVDESQREGQITLPEARERSF